MSYNNRLPAKFDPTPKRHHGWTFLIFLFGILLPPIAVAARFGIGSDFFLNCFLCICGYIPSHGHNFYIQNIRNNDGRKRTPKWIKKAGLVDDSEDRRRAARSQWAKRYDERLPNSTLDDADLAEGEEGGNYVPSRTIDEEEVARRRREGLWTNEEEEYYNEERRDAAPNQQHWHYPANFEGSEAAPPKFHLPGSKSKSPKKRTDASAYAPKSNSSADRPWDAQFDDDVPEWGREYGSGGAGSGANAGRGASQRRSTLGSDDGYGGGGGVGNGSARAGGNKRDSARVGGGRSEREEDWNHQF